MTNTFHAVLSGAQQQHIQVFFCVLHMCAPHAIAINFLRCSVHGLWHSIDSSVTFCVDIVEGNLPTRRRISWAIVWICRECMFQWVVLPKGRKIGKFPEMAHSWETPWKSKLTLVVRTNYSDILCNECRQICWSWRILGPHKLCCSAWAVPLSILFFTPDTFAPFRSQHLFNPNAFRAYCRWIFIKSTRTFLLLLLLLSPLLLLLLPFAVATDIAAWRNRNFISPSNLNILSNFSVSFHVGKSVELMHAINYTCFRVPLWAEISPCYLASVRQTHERLNTEALNNLAIAQTRTDFAR